MRMKEWNDVKIDIKNREERRTHGNINFVNILHEVCTDALFIIFCVVFLSTAVKIHLKEITLQDLVATVLLEGGILFALVFSVYVTHKRKRGNNV